jgi:hypothetical protein
LDNYLPKIVQRRFPMVTPAVARASDGGTPHSVGVENVIVRFQKSQEMLKNFMGVSLRIPKPTCLLLKPERESDSFPGGQIQKPGVWGLQT